MEDQIFIGLKSFKQTLVEALYLVVALKWEKKNPLCLISSCESCVEQRLISFRLSIVFLWDWAQSVSSEDPGLDPPVMTSLTAEAHSVVIDHSSALCPGHVVVIFLLWLLWFSLSLKRDKPSYRSLTSCMTLILKFKRGIKGGLNINVERDRKNSYKFVASVWPVSYRISLLFDSLWGSLAGTHTVMFSFSVQLPLGLSLLTTPLCVASQAASLSCLCFVSSHAEAVTKPHTVPAGLLAEMTHWK